MDTFMKVVGAFVLLVVVVVVMGLLLAYPLMLL